MAGSHVNLPPSEINWENSDHFIFLNPRWPKQDFENLSRAAISALSQISSPTGFLVLASSGTSQAAGNHQVQLKFIKKENFLAAARSFNSFFSITDRDLFLRALPTFHVGGLALYARAFLAKARVIDFTSEKWEPQDFVHVMSEKKATRVSLVPTQVFDLVAAGIHAPKSVDTVFVGGAALGTQLRNQAVALGWPLLCSYGMTETSSMIASQKYSERWQRDLPLKFFPLHGVAFRTDDDRRVFLRAPGLLSYELVVDLKSPLTAEPSLTAFTEGSELRTQDFGLWDGEVFEYLGRLQELIKISGELVSLSQLRRSWEDIAAEKSASTYLIDLPHPRVENEIVLVSQEIETKNELQSLIEKYNQRVLPFQRVKRWVKVERFPRSELGKILVNQLRAEVLEKEKE